MAGRVFSVEVTVHDQVTVLKPVGWLTAESRGKLEARLGAAVEKGSTRFVIDLSSAHLADSGGLAVFPFWQRRLADIGGCLVLASPSGSALRALRAGRVDKYLPVCDTTAEAVEMARQRTESGRWKAVGV
jgi:anti-anti-sigma factor